jgi:hypothetical protein
MVHHATLYHRKDAENAKNFFGKNLCHTLPNERRQNVVRAHRKMEIFLVGASLLANASFQNQQVRGQARSYTGFGRVG